MATGGSTPFGRHLECPICMERYTLGGKVPKNLPCGHVICCTCAERIISNGTITCPGCNKKHILPADGLDGFGRNHTIIGMLDYACVECHGYANTSACQLCEQRLCGSCLEDHIQAEYNSSASQLLNQVMDVKQKVNEHLPAYVSSTQTMLQECDRFCAESRDILKNNQLSVDSIVDIQAVMTAYVTRLQDIHDFIGKDYPRIDPDVQRFHLVKTFDKTNNDAIGGTPRVYKSIKYEGVPQRVIQTGTDDSDTYWSPHVASVNRRNGHLHVADCTKKGVRVYDGRGCIITTYGVDSEVRDLCDRLGGDMAVTGSNHQVTIHTGQVRRRLGQQGKLEFGELWGITTDNDGLMYVCDSTNQCVHVIGASGSVVHVIGKHGPNKLQDPISVAVHPLSGDVYVADWVRHCVNIYQHDGRYLSSIAKQNIAGVSDFQPRYLAFRTDGLLCMSDRHNDAVHIMHDHVYVQTIGGNGSDKGEFKRPRGVMFTASGELIVCDTDNHRIQIFSIQ